MAGDFHAAVDHYLSDCEQSGRNALQMEIPAHPR